MPTFRSLLSRVTLRPSSADIDLVRKSELLDPDWYRSQYADLRFSQVDPVVHYLRKGAAERRNPGPDFDTAYYLATYPDVAASSVNPLVHYLRVGAREGRRISADHIAFTPLEAIEVDCRKPVEIRARMALVVTYALNGSISSHVDFYLRKLVMNNISPVLIVATDRVFQGVDDSLFADLSGLYVREDDGQDFSAWAHIMRLNPCLFDVSLLVFINDRFLGPIEDESFAVILNRIELSESQFISLTDGYSREWHIEPYFWALKSEELGSPPVREYFSSIVSLLDKSHWFTEHLVPLMRALAGKGVAPEILFPSKPGDTSNRTVREWRELISQGFPFLNVMVIYDDLTRSASEDWHLVLQAHGFPSEIANTFIHNSPEVDSVSRPSAKFRRDVRTLKDLRTLVKKRANAFSPELYLHLYPDVTVSGLDPLYHYRTFGHAEGRLGTLAGAERLVELAEKSDGSGAVLVVSHDGTRTGCPILSFNICKELAKDRSVIALFLDDGPVIEAFKSEGITTIGPILAEKIPRTYDNVISYIQSIIPIKYAIVNSVESRQILPALSRRYVPSIALVHEFSAYTRSATAFREAVRWAGETVFSAHLTRDDAIRCWPVLGVRTYPIMPQGRCLPPPAPNSGSAKALASTGAIDPSRTPNPETARIQKTLRPEGFPPSGIVIVGIGTVQFRKGVDIFLECASIIRKESARACRFVWVGSGYRPAEDFEYSAYLADQIQRAGLSDCVEFAGETAEMLEVYAAADVLLLTSRLDPLPNVAIEAMDSGLPVFCFNNATGIADILIEQNLMDELVAEYLNVDELARKVVATISSPDRLSSLSLKVREVVKQSFDMSRYVEQIDLLSKRVTSSVEQERSDALTISENVDFIRFDYCISPNQLEKRTEDIVRDYVRSWASGIDTRKLAPGFHPGVYLTRHGVEGGGDPLADYLRRGRPSGPWSYPVITPRLRPQKRPDNLRIGLHIHVHYPELLPELLGRLAGNRVRPDLLISVTSAGIEARVVRLLRNYRAKIDVRVTPNRGRDIGPMFSEFAQELLNNYDIIGHVHTKKTADIRDPSVGRAWYRFLIENLIGGRAPMADIILGNMAENPRLGLVFADDPHVVGWDANRPYVEPLLSSLALGPLPPHMHVPIGTMFWARPSAIGRMFELRLRWDDYPMEPLPYDGSMLHGMERLFGLVVESAGYTVAGVNCPGVTR